jgi:predicted Zn-dependent protease
MLRFLESDDEIAVILGHEIERIRACAHEVWVGWTEEITSGRRKHDHAWISVGMIRFAESEDELAVAIGHELAHRILGGRDRSYPKNELRADEIGLLLAARTGYDETVAPAFWERFALEKPWMIRWEPDSKRAKEPRHARVAERLLAMPGYLEEIARLRSEGMLTR